MSQQHSCYFTIGETIINNDCGLNKAHNTTLRGRSNVRRLNTAVVPQYKLLQSNCSKVLGGNYLQGSTGTKQRPI